MKSLILIAGFAVILAAPIVSAAPPQKGAQQTIAVEKLPSAVTAAVLKAYPSSTIVSAATFARGKQVAYELSVKPTPDAQPVSVMASADGTIRTAGRAAPATGTPPAKGQRKGAATNSLPARPIVEVKDLPKAVTNAIKDAYPKDTILSAVKISTGPPVIYELSLNDVGSLLPLRVVVTSEGQIQKR